MAEKVAVIVLVLKVDLQCSRCYKKIKKLLCKFPQIRDQKYDDKQNQVIITVVCCSPEKIRDKLCCKGGKVIKTIDFEKPPKLESTNTKESEKQKESDESGKSKESEKLKESESAPPPCQPIHVEVQYGCPPYPGRGCCGPCSKGYPGGPCYHEHKRPTLLPPPPPYPGRRCCGPCSEGYSEGPCYHEHERPTLLPLPLPYLGRGCCGPCSEGYPGGPCYHEHKRPTLPPPPSYEGYGYGYGGGKGCRVSRCDYYFSEENPQGCTIM